MLESPTLPESPSLPALSLADIAKHLGVSRLPANKADVKVQAILAPAMLGAVTEAALATCIMVVERAELAQLENNPRLQQLGALITAAGEESLPALPCPVLLVATPRLALAALSQLFVPPAPAPAVHPSAQIDPSAALAAGVFVGPNAVVGARTRIAAGCFVGAGCVLGNDVVLAEGVTLQPNVTLYAKTEVGERSIVHSGTVIGSDGFGYAFGPQGAVKIHHLGRVVIAQDVEIGANCCIDRGTLGDTLIGERCKLDNLCQIGHNVSMGSDCVIAGGAAIGGSCSFGPGVIVGGSVAMKDHLTIGAGARIAGRAGVTKDVPPGERWGGFPAKAQRAWVREIYILSQLDALWSKLRFLLKDA